jgi:hypothetical protein
MSANPSHAHCPRCVFSLVVSGVSRPVRRGYGVAWGILGREAEETRKFQKIALNSGCFNDSFFFPQTAIREKLGLKGAKSN